MKPIHSFLACVLPCLAQAESIPASPFPPKGAFRNAVTHQELIERLRTSEEADPMKHMASATGDDPSKAAPPDDFLKQSDVLCYNGLATFVPKRAILATPPNIKERIGIQEGVQIVSWLEFLQQNRGWISTLEVDRQQAEGTKPFPEETTKHIAKSTNLIVATYKGGPISVLPPAGDAASTKPSETP
jgi:hypothetical protein